MSDTNALSVLPSAASHAKDIGQITAIEQARAVAEVQARVIVAQNHPRNLQAAIAEMEMVCQQKLLADRAFYNVPRGGTTLTDASIHLAKELARCWGNIDYEVAELRRDDVKGHSEMMAWAWDMQANNKASIKFQVPHTRDMKTGSKRMNDINDIYNLLANMGSRRVREMILKILPTWFVERAKELCYKTLEDGGGVPLPQRIAAAIKTFDAMGVPVDRIEHKFGVKADKWTPHHLAQLTVIRTSLHQNTTTVDEEFPVQPVRREDLQQADPPPGAEFPHALVSNDRLQKIHSLLSQLVAKDCMVDPEDIAALVGNPNAIGPEKLNNTEADILIDVLTRLSGEDQPAHALDALLNSLAQTEPDSNE